MPDSITQNDQPFAAPQLFLGKGAAKERWNAHQRKEIRRYERALDLLRFLASESNHGPAPFIEDSQVLKGMYLTPPFEVVLVTCASVGDRPTNRPRVADPQHGQSVGIVVGQRTKQHCMHNAKNRSIGANTQRQDQHRKNCESWRFPQCAQTVAKVLPARLQKKRPSRRVDDFLGGLESPPLQAYCPKSFLGGHPLLGLFFGRHRKEAVQLFVQLSRRPFFFEQRAKPACYVSQ